MTKIRTTAEIEAEAEEIAPAELGDPVATVTEEPPKKEAADELSEEELEQRLKAKRDERAKKKARIAEVYHRGQVGTRLNVALPPTLHGIWAHKDPGELAYYKGLGYKIDEEFAVNNSLHNDGTGVPMVGDVVFMTCDRETFEIIEEVRRDDFNVANKKQPIQAEERNFRNRVNAELGGRIQATSESTAVDADEATIHDLAAERRNQNTSPRDLQKEQIRSTMGPTSQRGKR
jgi:hypothetical protein